MDKITPKSVEEVVKQIKKLHPADLNIVGLFVEYFTSEYSKIISSRYEDIEMHVAETWRPLCPLCEKRTLRFVVGPVMKDGKVRTSVLAIICEEFVPILPIKGCTIVHGSDLFNALVSLYTQRVDEFSYRSSMNQLFISKVKELIKESIDIEKNIDQVNEDAARRLNKVLNFVLEEKMGRPLLYKVYYRYTDSSGEVKGMKPVRTKSGVSLVLDNLKHNHGANVEVFVTDMHDVPLRDFEYANK
jgi:hypothetical protein